MRILEAISYRMIGISNPIKYLFVAIFSGVLLLFIGGSVAIYSAGNHLTSGGSMKKGVALISSKPLGSDKLSIISSHITRVVLYNIQLKKLGDFQFENGQSERALVHNLSVIDEMNRALAENNSLDKEKFDPFLVGGITEQDNISNILVSISSLDEVRQDCWINESSQKMPTTLSFVLPHDRAIDRDFISLRDGFIKRMRGYGLNVVKAGSDWEAGIKALFEKTKIPLADKPINCLASSSSKDHQPAVKASENEADKQRMNTDLVITIRWWEKNNVRAPGYGIVLTDNQDSPLLGHKIKSDSNIGVYKVTKSGNFASASMSIIKPVLSNRIHIGLAFGRLYYQAIDVKFRSSDGVEYNQKVKFYDLFVPSDTINAYKNDNNGWISTSIGEICEKFGDKKLF